MSVTPPISISVFAKAGWNFFNHVTPKPTSATRMVAIGMIVSAVALVLIAKISLFTGLAVTLGACALVNHADLKASAEAQKELEEIRKNFKEAQASSSSENHELENHVESFIKQVAELQESISQSKISAHELKQNILIIESKVNSHQELTDNFATTVKKFEEKNVTLGDLVNSINSNLKNFMESSGDLKDQLSSLKRFREDLDAVNQQFDLLQREDRGNYENLSSSFLENAARLEAVTQRLEKFKPIEDRIESMDKRLSECWELTQRIRQEQQAPRVAPAQQFQQVVRTAAGMQYRR